MPRPKPEPVLHAAIAGNLAVLADIVGNAVEALGEAQAAQAAGRQKEAIGAILGLDDRLTEAIALQRAILTIHRYR